MGTIRRRMTGVVGACLLLVSYNEGLAQSPVPSLSGVKVSARVSSFPSDEIVTFEYRLKHEGAALQILGFLVDVSSDSTRRVLSNVDLSFAGTVLENATRNSLASLKPFGVVAIGGSAPQNWSIAVDPEGRVGWGEISTATLPGPGSMFGGFVIRSRGLPTIRDAAVEPDILALLPDINVVPSAPELGAAADQNVRTLGPAAPPVQLDLLVFLSDLVSMRTEAAALGWVREGAGLAEMDTLLGEVDAALETQDFTTVKNKADELIAHVESISCTAFDCPATTPLTAEARALLVWNMRFLRDNIDRDADGVVDLEDNCEEVTNPDQRDRGGVGAGSASDGIGDVCQCGEVNNSGTITGTDGLYIHRAFLHLAPFPAGPDQSQQSGSVFFVAGRCDVNGDGQCTNVDGDIVNAASLGLPPGVQQTCAGEVFPQEE